MLYSGHAVEFSVPPGIVAGWFRIKLPLVKPSKLTLDRSEKNLVGFRQRAGKEGQERPKMPPLDNHSTAITL